MQDILNLQNFNQLQQIPPLGNLQNLQRAASLNLSIGGTPGGVSMTSGMPIGLGLPQSPQMPQLILSGGQLGQGIQGAQLLIPTANGKCKQICCYCICKQ